MIKQLARAGTMLIALLVSGDKRKQQPGIEMTTGTIGKEGCIMTSPSRPHDLTVLELLRNDPALVGEYLAVAIE